ncbi:MAG TPA: 4Fe-4S dicluster domain-containing protein, partial [Chitinophagaceae bacterium]
VFNRGKIVDTPPMNAFLRYGADQNKQPVATVFDFSKQEGILHLAEKCSGSGDCRKSHLSGGTMCPSFMATRSERDTTRARANMLRHYYTGKTYGSTNGSSASEAEVKNILDLCLSCKGCKSECPSSVDVGKMKAEFTQEYYDRHGVPFRSRLVGNFSSQMKMASVFPQAYNFLFRTTPLRRLVNRIVGFHPDRSMPLLHSTTLRSWYKKYRQSRPLQPDHRNVVLFCDEFTNYNDVQLGQKAVLLLERLGYNVLLMDHHESGRTWLSKGMVRKAKEVAIRNTTLFKQQLDDATPIIGIEPSAILTLRDEYPELVPAAMHADAKRIAAQAFLFEEWFAAEITAGRISATSFAGREAAVRVHGHCHQKSLSSVQHIVAALSVVPGFQVTEIPSGCCGMAGAFGYEKEHYDVSMQIGELVLFPAVRQMDDTMIVAASGTSCRHQIKDGTGKKAMHTAEILYDALA